MTRNSHFPRPAETDPYEAEAVVNLLRYELAGKFSDEAGEFLSPVPLLT